MAQEEAENGTLARRIAAGRADTEAEAELVRRFGLRVRLYGLRHLRDEAAADDLVQQVLVLVLESLRDGRLREPERLDSFVLGSCRMMVRDLRRGDRRRERLRGLYLSAEEAATDCPPELDLGRLRGCVEKLPARERTVVVLTFYGERSGEEIAAELSMTPGHVRVVRHRAVASLRHCLGLEGGEPR